MQCVSTISFSDNWDLFLQKGGIFSLTPNGIKSASMSNLLTAITDSPFSSNTSIPLCLVSSLSEMKPVKRLERNVMVPEGEISIRPLNVLLIQKCDWI